MSSRNEEVLKLKNKIIECQEETLRLLQERQGWPTRYNLMEQAKKRAVDDLTRQSTETSEFEKELDDLYEALKAEEKFEDDLKSIFETLQASYEEHRKDMEKVKAEVRDMMDLADKGFLAMLEKRVEIEKRLENLNVFSEAVHSTLKAKKSDGVSLVKESQLDHHGGQNGPNMPKRRVRKRRGSKEVSVGTVA